MNVYINMSNLTDGLLTEGGLLALAGLITAFLVKCCSQIEASRCTEIDCCGVKCVRQVLSEAHLAEREENEVLELGVPEVSV